jgi:hypothetical protein
MGVSFLLIFPASVHRHCEERSDEAIQLSFVAAKGSWIASLGSQ